MVGESFDEGIAFGAIGRIHLDLDQLMGFKRLIEFFEETGMYPLLTHPYGGAQMMGAFLEFPDSSRRKSCTVGLVLIDHERHSSSLSGLGILRRSDGGVARCLLELGRGV